MTNWILLYDINTNKNVALLVHNITTGEIGWRSGSKEMSETLDGLDKQSFTTVDTINGKKASATIPVKIDKLHPEFLSHAIKPLLAQYRISSQGTTQETVELTLQKLSQYLHHY